MFVYDYVLYNEEPIIEFRLKYLKNYVDRFIIVESIYTFSGNKKEDFCFNMNKDIFGSDSLGLCAGQTPKFVKHFQSSTPQSMAANGQPLPLLDPLPPLLDPQSPRLHHLPQDPC